MSLRGRRSRYPSQKPVSLVFQEGAGGKRRPTEIMPTTSFSVSAVEEEGYGARVSPPLHRYTRHFQHTSRNTASLLRGVC